MDMGNEAMALPEGDKPSRMRNELTRHSAWPVRHAVAVWGLLLLATSIIPWGLAGGRPLWSWMLFSGRAYSTLGATLVAAWTLGFIALVGSKMLKGFWLAAAYFIPGATALGIFIHTTKGNLAPWTAFIPVTEPFPWLHVLCVLLCAFSLIASGLRGRSGETNANWLRTYHSICGLLGLIVIAHSSCILIHSGWQLSGAEAWLTMSLGAIGAGLGVRSTVLTATDRHCRRALTERRSILAALGVFFFAGIVGQMSHGQFFSMLFGALNNGILVAGISLITIEGVIGLCLSGPEFHSVSPPRTKNVLCAASVLAAALVATVAIKGAHVANHRPVALPPTNITSEVPRTGDWRQWCGAWDRNMVSNEKNLPEYFDELTPTRTTGLSNVKWVAPLNSHYVFGSPVVAEGKVLLGGSSREPGQSSESAMLWCFQESDGKLLWRMRSPYITKLYNQGSFGICSTPTVENGRAYLLGHLGDVLCLDMNGQNDGNQGPFTNEPQYFASGARCIRNEVAEDGSHVLECTPGTPANISTQDADILWRFDMLREVNCFPFNALNPSVIVRGDRVYVATCSIQATTGDGSLVRIKPWEEKNKKKYDSPSLIVLDKNTGKLLARERQNIFNGTFHGAYSSPSLGKVNGRDVLVYGGGNGVCYAFDPDFASGNDGKPAELGLIWKFDCLDPASYGPEFRIDHLQKAEIIGTPVIYKNRIYVTIGNDMIRSGEAARQGRLICVDATQFGDVTRTARIWSFDDIRSTASTVAIADGLIYVTDAGGSVYCLDADTGQLHWTHKTGIVWSSPLVADGKVYVGTHTNGLLVFAHGKEKKILFESASTMDIVGSPAVSHGVLYVASQKHLYALEAGKRGGLTAGVPDGISQARTREPAHATAKPPDVPVNMPEPKSLVQFSKNWPGFRGPGGSGIASDAKPPLTWDGRSSKNVRWRSALPLPGKNSPVVWENRVLLCGADRKHYAIFCFALDTGALSWRTDLSRAPDAKIPEVIEDAGYAAPTMVTNGQYACAIFACGLAACVGIDGRIIWQKELGLPENHYGHASSLALWHNLLLVQLDQAGAEDEKSALIAFDLATGEQVWRTKRSVGTSWSTPIVNTVATAGGTHDEILTAATPYVIAYSPKEGSELWRANVLSGEVAPSPVYSNGMAYVCNTGAQLTAIRTDGSGDVTPTHVVWTAEDDLPDTVSPVCTSTSLLIISPGGMLSCFDSRKGTVSWQHNFASEQFRASPILASNRVYLTNTKGLTHVFEMGSEFKELGQGKLDDEVTASAACVGNSLIVRGKKTLYCISEK